jgi:hypothetical protein
MSGLFFINVPIKKTTNMPWQILAEISPKAVQTEFLNP